MPIPEQPQVPKQQEISAAQLEKLEKLGGFVMESRAMSGTQKTNIGVASLCLVFLVGFTIFALIYGLKTSDPLLGALACPLLPVFLTGLTLQWVLNLLRQTKSRFLLHEGGFLHEQADGTTVALWDDVKSMKEMILQFIFVSEHKVTLEIAKGRTIELNPLYENMPALAQAIRNRVTTAILNKAVERLQQGEAVSFGTLKLSNAGLDNGQEKIEWKEVEKITIEGRTGAVASMYTVVIRKRGKRFSWYQCTVPNFPNFDAFLSLARQFTKVEHPAEFSPNRPSS